MASRKRKNVSGHDLKAEEELESKLIGIVFLYPILRLGKNRKELGKSKDDHSSTSCSEVFKTPSTAEEWNRITTKFWEKWNSPNTICAIDGKHILLKAPTNTGSLHYNYKGGFSTVLLAICDADYKCVYADVGNYGKDSDGGIFGRCSFKEALDRKVLNLPEAKNLPGTDVFTPLFIVGDAAFPLRDNIMRPFPGDELDYGRMLLLGTMKYEKLYHEDTTMKITTAKIPPPGTSTKVPRYYYSRTWIQH
uniref:DDE Tnp4 domain-containing protein n=1 Tax=Ditylenchus dipsaci TaxID=166011 RepID=A0A915DZ35_9BILA